LPAAVVPVAVGYAFVVSRHDESLDSITNVALALVVSVALQVGVNYANDYSDGIKGTDAKRVGPVRLVGSALAAAKSVKRAAYLSFLIAAIAGLGIAATTSWWLIAVGVAAIVAAWTYTGGPSPYGYLGFGELFVFVFFGVVATAGTTYAVSEQVRTIEVVGSCVVGLLAVAILVVNNLRDIPTDSLAGKMTLAVRLGDSWTRRLYVGIVVASAIGVALVARTHTWAIVALVGYAFAVEPAKRVVRGARGAELIPVLGATARVQLVVGLLLAFGLVAS
jgi:1,4-dihydroxy-2-naphthoate octaprenyltransferase